MILKVSMVTSSSSRRGFVMADHFDDAAFERASAHDDIEISRSQSSDVSGKMAPALRGG
ncbi:hypothetical protein [Beijerinckia indica]|uniref:hypothetical protein n=1 Tax=Beijerinckia indica TaxID=533 RepID=UPI0013053149|nr:hypothetical protein [Beijerinckia indica]